MGCRGTQNTHGAHGERKKSGGKQQKRRRRPMKASSVLSPIPLVSFSTRTKPQERNAEANRVGVYGQDGADGNNREDGQQWLPFFPFPFGQVCLVGARLAPWSQTASARSLRRRCLSLYSSHSRSPFHTLYFHIQWYFFGFYFYFISRSLSASSKLSQALI